jgi:predicted DNA-binding protein with PD1-like motif
MAMARFDHNNPNNNTNHLMNQTEIGKAEQTHVEYGHSEHDHAVHTPKEDEPLGGYLHKGTAFEKKVLRKIDWRLVPVLCELFILSSGGS